MSKELNIKIYRKHAMGVEAMLIKYIYNIYSSLIIVANFFCQP